MKLRKTLDHSQQGCSVRLLLSEVQLSFRSIDGQSGQPARDAVPSLIARLPQHWQQVGLRVRSMARMVAQADQLSVERCPPYPLLVTKLLHDLDPSTQHMRLVLEAAIDIRRYLPSIRVAILWCLMVMNHRHLSSKRADVIPEMQLEVCRVEIRCRY